MEIIRKSGLRPMGQKGRRKGTEGQANFVAFENLSVRTDEDLENHAAIVFRDLLQARMVASFFNGACVSNLKGVEVDLCR